MKKKEKKTENTGMRLNYKNTILVGFAFAIISAFWYAYDFLVPLMLNRTFGLSDAMRGLVMGLDNILALVLLPLFGTISDKVNTKMGKRTPFLLVGTILSVVCLVILPVVENIQTAEVKKTMDSSVITVEQAYDNAIANDILTLDKIAAADEKSTSIEGVMKAYMLSNKKADGTSYDLTSEADVKQAFKSITNKDVMAYNYVFLPCQNVQKLAMVYDSEKPTGISRDDFIRTTEKIVESGKSAKNLAYNEKIQPVVEDYIYHNYTAKNPGVLVGFMIMLFLLLLAMASFRSPAVALMPDVTPKPLRSKANAIINLMGGVGQVLVMLFMSTIILKFVSSGAYDNYIWAWTVVGVLMIIMLGIYMGTVRENKLVQQKKDLCAEFCFDDDDDTEEAKQEGVTVEQLSKGKKTSFFLLLGSIFMWFMGHNAVNSNLSVYLTQNLGFETSMAGNIVMAATIFSAVAFIPVGWMATKFGRKKTILVGLVLAIIAFIIGYFVQPSFNWLFVISWFMVTYAAITINVNTLPMVLETCKGADVGKYTGIYYTATMSAQAITPFLVGLFMNFGREYMFIYAIVFFIISLVLLVFVKHGDSRAVPKKSVLEHFDVED